MLIRLAWIACLACAVGWLYRAWVRRHQRIAGRQRRSLDWHRAHEARHPRADALLLSETSALIAREAKWADVLKTLNPSDDPQVRTVLLELRWSFVNDPLAALHFVSEACRAASVQSRSPSRLELLDVAKRLADIGG